VITEFRAVTDKSLPTINASLAKKKLEKIVVPTEADWQKEHSGAVVAQPKGLAFDALKPLMPQIRVATK
jgi:hypothetical protein